MTDQITLDGADAIRQWIKEMSPKLDRLIPILTQHSLALTINGDEMANKYDKYFSVEHVLLHEGLPMMLVARVYIAQSAEEALLQHVFGPASYLHGSKTKTVFIKQYRWQFYPEQEIRVAELPNGDYEEY